MYNNIPTKVLTGEVRLSYVNLVTPRVNNNDPTATPKYSVTLLIPKTDIAVKQNIDASIGAAFVPRFCLSPSMTAMVSVRTVRPMALSARAAGC